MVCVGQTHPLIRNEFIGFHHGKDELRYSSLNTLEHFPSKHQPFSYDGKKMGSWKPMPEREQRRRKSIYGSTSSLSHFFLLPFHSSLILTPYTSLQANGETGASPSFPDTFSFSEHILEPDSVGLNSTPPLTNFVTSAKLYNHAVSQFLHLYNGDRSTFLIGLLRELISMNMCKVPE